jgi:hypothetical protein
MIGTERSAGVSSTSHLGGERILQALHRGGLLGISEQLAHGGLVDVFQVCLDPPDVPDRIWMRPPRSPTILDVATSVTMTAPAARARATTASTSST